MHVVPLGSATTARCTRFLRPVRSAAPPPRTARPHPTIPRTPTASTAVRVSAAAGNQPYGRIRHRARSGPRPRRTGTGRGLTRRRPRREARRRASAGGVRGGELVRRVYADAFPPQVSIDEGVAELTHVAIHAVETPGEGPDLLLLTGDHQAQSNEGHYHLTDTFLDIADEFGVERLFALGGVPTGELIDEPSCSVRRRPRISGDAGRGGRRLPRGRTGRRRRRRLRPTARPGGDGPCRPVASWAKRRANWPTPRARRPSSNSAVRRRVRG